MGPWLQNETFQTPGAKDYGYLASGASAGTTRPSTDVVVNGIAKGTARPAKPEGYADHGWYF